MSTKLPKDPHTLQNDRGIPISRPERKVSQGAHVQSCISLGIDIFLNGFSRSTCILLWGNTLRSRRLVRLRQTFFQQKLSSTNQRTKLVQQIPTGIRPSQRASRSLSKSLLLGHSVFVHRRTTKLLNPLVQGHKQRIFPGDFLGSALSPSKQIGSSCCCSSSVLPARWSSNDCTSRSSRFSCTKLAIFASSSST